MYQHSIYRYALCTNTGTCRDVHVPGFYPLQASIRKKKSISYSSLFFMVTLWVLKQVLVKANYVIVWIPGSHISEKGVTMINCNVLHHKNMQSFYDKREHCMWTFYNPDVRSTNCTRFEWKRQNKMKIQFILYIICLKNFGKMV